MSAAQDESLKVVLGDIQASLDIERGETAALLSTLVQERDAALMAAHRAQRQALLLADARAAERQHIAAERNLLDTYVQQVSTVGPCAVALRRRSAHWRPPNTERGAGAERVARLCRQRRCTRDN